MAEMLDSTAIVPSSDNQKNGYAFRLVEYDAAANASVLMVPVPDDSREFKQWNILARAALLKKTTWARFSIEQTILGVLFSDRVGLDIELGDVYSIDGRPAITAEGRIKLAQKDPRYRGSKTTWKELETPLGKQQCILKNDLECTVEVYVDGWQEPIRRTARLSRWYKNTPAWNERPEHQLELNTLGHACRFLRPVADPSDAPEPETSLAATAK
jgi:hypothetical protein